MFDSLATHLSNTLNGWFSQKKYISRTAITQIIGELRTALLAADTPLAVVDKSVGELEKKLSNTLSTQVVAPREQCAKIIREHLVELLGITTKSTRLETAPLILLCGLQGSGKTTTAGKLATYLRTKSPHKSPRILLGSVDFDRPAARAQLRALSLKAGVDYYESQSTTPFAAAQEIVTYGKKAGYDHVIIDTAGRMHIDTQLLAELRTIQHAMNPTHTILVLDGMTGQSALSLTQEFSQAVSLSGAIITKAEGDMRGGAMVAFRAVTGKPILFLGTGEHLDDLTPFIAERIANRIMGLGDLASLAEAAERKLLTAATNNKKPLGADFGLEEFAEVISTMQQLGSLATIMRFMPKIPGLSLSDQQLNEGSIKLKQFKAIIHSMTDQERRSPRLINTSRAQRIAQGAGVQRELVTQLIKQFEETQHFVKILHKTGQKPTGPKPTGQRPSGR